MNLTKLIELSSNKSYVKCFAMKKKRVENKGYFTN